MNGAERIAAERRRQIEAEGWTPKHDDEHELGELADAAACYAATDELLLRDRRGRFADAWPWDSEWDKRPRDDEDRLVPAEKQPIEVRIRSLQKAGALIAAEIDRLLRLECADRGEQQWAALAEAARLGRASWIEDGVVKDAPPVDGRLFGRHWYDDEGTSDCKHGCGCWAGPYRSGGPVHPFGPCPKNPL